LYIDGFKAGALATKPSDRVNVSYTGSFSDVSLMATAAETHIAAGADILTGSSQSVVGAIGVCKDKKACGSAPSGTRPAWPPPLSSPARSMTGPASSAISSPAVMLAF